jgi:2-phospho-L-lactate guanylyltransferase
VSGSLWAVLPVKALCEAKGRLSGLLCDEARRSLMRSLYLTALAALKETVPIHRIVVISDGDNILSLARESGACPLRQFRPGLNEAVRQGERYAVEAGATAVLVMLADLPLVTGEAVEKLIAVARGETGKVGLIAPAQRGGTSALLLGPPGWVDYRFGRDSYRRHWEQLERAADTVLVYRSPAFMIDIDTPRDLSRVLSSYPQLLETWRATYAVNPSFCWGPERIGAAKG